MTNAFEVLLGGAFPGLGLYETPAMMNHDCVANTRLTVDGANHEMTVRASVDIVKGEAVTFNYVSALDPTHARQRTLREFKMFSCRCRRCADPTEMGTFCSAIVAADNGKHECPGSAKEDRLYALPRTRQEEDGVDWACSTCGADLAAEAVEASLQRLEKVRDEVAKAKVGKLLILYLG